MIDVSIAENNKRGNRSGKVTQIEFTHEGESFLRLESNDPFTGEPIRTSPHGTIEIYGLRIAHSGWTSWHGNMMWNRYSVPDEYALGLILILQRSRKWSVMEGWENLFEKFKSLDTITGKDIGLHFNVQPEVINPNQLQLL